MLNRLRAWNINAKFSYALIRQLTAKQYLVGARYRPSNGILLSALSVERVGQFGSQVREAPSLLCPFPPPSSNFHYYVLMKGQHIMLAIIQRPALHSVIHGFCDQEDPRCKKESTRNNKNKFKVYIIST